MITWNILCMLLILHAMLTIPFRISFEDVNNNWDYFDTFDTIADFVFLFDILVNFNTAFYEKGNL